MDHQVSAHGRKAGRLHVEHLVVHMLILQGVHRAPVVLRMCPRTLMLFCKVLQCKVHLVRNILMVSARVVVTVVRRINSCLTFIVVCAVYDVAVCGIHVTSFIFFFGHGHLKYCKRIIQKVGVVLWTRF